jgi:hypothetical protein
LVDKDFVAATPLLDITPNTLQGEMLSFGASSNHFAANVLVNYASGVQGSGQTAVRWYPSPDDIDIKLDIVSKYAIRKSQLWQGQRVVFLLSLCDKFDN